MAVRMAPQVHRSPERKYRAIAVILVASAGLRTIFGGPTETWAVIAIAIVSLLLLLWAGAIWRSRTILTEDALEDVGSFRRRTIPRSEVAAVSIARTAGLWDGFAIRLDLADGTGVPVTSSRVYSVVPLRSHLADLESYLQQVRRWLDPKD